MIDYEEIVFDAVAAALRARYNDIYVIGVELSDVPPRFPAVSFVQKNNETNKKYSTFECVENVASEEYEANVYSNLESTKEAKAQTKEIVEVIDEVMLGLYYPRTFCQPIPNADTRYTRRVARYKKTNVV